MKIDEYMKAVLTDDHLFVLSEEAFEMWQDDVKGGREEFETFSRLRSLAYMMVKVSTGEVLSSREGRTYDPFREFKFNVSEDAAAVHLPDLEAWRRQVISEGPIPLGDIPATVDGKPYILKNVVANPPKIGELADEANIQTFELTTGRPGWDDYFMGFAQAAARRATCSRKHVGAVIVVDHQVVATGYNGSVRGMPHCDDAGHDMQGGHCVRVIHAEMNALAQAAKRGVSVAGASIYTTASPCWDCFRVLVNAGIVCFVFLEAYRSEESITRIREVADITGVEVRSLA